MGLLMILRLWLWLWLRLLALWALLGRDSLWPLLLDMGKRLVLHLRRCVLTRC